MCEIYELNYVLVVAPPVLFVYFWSARLPLAASGCRVPCHAVHAVICPLSATMSDGFSLSPQRETAVKDAVSSAYEEALGVVARQAGCASWCCGVRYSCTDPRRVPGSPIVGPLYQT